MSKARALLVQHAVSYCQYRVKLLHVIIKYHQQLFYISQKVFFHTKQSIPIQYGKFGSCWRSFVLCNVLDVSVKQLFVFFSKRLNNIDRQIEMKSSKRCYVDLIQVDLLMNKFKGPIYSVNSFLLSAAVVLKKIEFLIHRVCIYSLYINMQCSLLQYIDLFQHTISDGQLLCVLFVASQQQNYRVRVLLDVIRHVALASRFSALDLYKPLTEFHIYSRRRRRHAQPKS